ncbi:hypothetical protein CFC21_075068 [Triticum aestivum]|uniref:Uncharacterized protein n=3 Tax=Triticum TaxID=4564 RepID=A0A9R1AU82_TRITD|nr:hypothetical protein CFC21_075068 [Triticum aestivum]VAI40328.1 unnamed protein product [Triticum turgidum subsp. durum]
MYWNFNLHICQRLDYLSSFMTRIRGTVGEVTPADSASPPAIVWRRQGEGHLGFAALCMAIEVQHRHDVYGFSIFLISPGSEFYKLLRDAQWPGHALVRFMVQSSKSRFEVRCVTLISCCSPARLHDERPDPREVDVTRTALSPPSFLFPTTTMSLYLLILLFHPW